MLIGASASIYTVKRNLKIVARKLPDLNNLLTDIILCDVQDFRHETQVEMEEVSGVGYFLIFG